MCKTYRSFGSKCIALWHSWCGGLQQKKRCGIDIAKVEEFADYQIEIAKRLKKKSEKEAKAFKEKLKAQYEKATDNLTVKQLREYKQATHEAMKKRIESMSVKELQESGLDIHKHFKNPEDKAKDKKDMPKDTKK